MSHIRWIRAITWSVGSCVLGYVAAITWAGWDQTTDTFSKLGWPLILTGAALASSAYIWRFVRWNIALRWMGYSLPIVRHFGIYLSGLALTSTPGKTGETFRSALLLQDNVRIPHSLAAFLADRGSDLIGMCLLATGSAWLTGHAWAVAWTLAFFGFLFGSTLFAFLLVHQFATPRWQRWVLRVTYIPLKGGHLTLSRPDGWYRPAG